MGSVTTRALRRFRSQRTKFQMTIRHVQRVWDKHYLEQPGQQRPRAPSRLVRLLEGAVVEALLWVALLQSSGWNAQTTVGAGWGSKVERASRGSSQFLFYRRA